MWNPSPLSSLPLKIAFIISFFLSYCFFFILLSPNPQPPLSFHLNSKIAVELQSCFNFIVPFNPTTNTPPDYRFNLINQLSQSLTESRIQFPRHTLNSKARRDIARLAVDSGGDPGFVPICPTPMQKGFAYICYHIVKAQMKIDVNLQDMLMDDTL
uniref:Uncharacterized protein n=1 Tax=Lactuca sativa TaxID=4236 RepID=A0A9R1XFZ9_LACSA|nr:hypothetical protein LSAT_V11C400217400 [Lactuca sativa]